MPCDSHEPQIRRNNFRAGEQFVNNFPVLRLFKARGMRAFKGMRDNSRSENQHELELTLDGLPVALPPGHRSLNAINCYLEMLALEKQRVLHSLSVDGLPLNLALPLGNPENFSRIEAETVALKDTSVLLLNTALQQTDRARECVETAITLVLINDACIAHELWWNLAGQLKQPVLTLSLLPDNCHTPLAQLRRWQLQQIAAIISDVDETCRSADIIPLSNALENRVLPWLQKLGELISLWRETVMAGSRLEIESAAF